MFVRLKKKYIEKGITTHSTTTKIKAQVPVKKQHVKDSHTLEYRREYG
jgi:hypothetical protein